MNNKHFLFAVIVLTTVWLLVWAAGGGEVALVMGWVFDMFFGIIWGTAHAIRNGSPHAIGYGFSASLGPKALLATFPPTRREDGYLTFPAHQVWALGGGSGIGINLPPSGEFVLNRLGTAIPTIAENTGMGQVFFNGKSHEKTRPDHVRYRLFNVTRANISDPRAWIPKDTFEFITKQQGWNWMRSKIWMIDVPEHPYLNLSEDGEVVVHGREGGDPRPLKDIFGDIERMPPNTVFLDLIHIWDSKMATENSDLREASQADALAARAQSKKYRTWLNETTDVERKTLGGSMMQRAVDMSGTEDESGGVQRR